MNMVRCGKFVPEAFFSFSIYFKIKITKTVITYYLTVTLLNNQDNWLGDSPLSTLLSPLSTLHSPLSTLHSLLSTLYSPLSTLHCIFPGQQVLDT